MPVRNEERFLPAALASIAAQTVREWELVVVDDGSTDGTAAILAAAAADPRVRVQQNRAKGLVPALNQGLAACRAPLVARMDGDDIAHPQRLAVQLAILAAQPETGLVASSFRHFPRGHLKIGMLAYEQWQNALVSHDLIMADIFVESPFVHPGVTCRKDILTALGGYRDMGWAEDYDLWLRMAQAGRTLCQESLNRFSSGGTGRSGRPGQWRSTLPMPSADASCITCATAFCRELLKLSWQGQAKRGGHGSASWRKRGYGLRSGWMSIRKKAGACCTAPGLFRRMTLAPGAGSMLVTVGTRGARAGIRQWAAKTGFRELTDFICVT